MKRCLLGLLTLLVGILLSGQPALAQTCIEAGGLSSNFYYRIGLWIESDMGEELGLASQQYPLPSEVQVRNYILQHMETWNLETRAIPIRYEGVGDWENNEDFCDAMSNADYLPVYVHFETSAANGGGMRVKRINSADPDCGDMLELIVYKYQSSLNENRYVLGTETCGMGGDSCSSVADCCSPYCVNNTCLDPDWKPMSNSLLHELGHVAGLGHAHEVGECRSVMAYHNYDSDDDGTDDTCVGASDGGRHPLTWDKNCVEQGALSSAWNVYGKLLTGHSATWNSSGQITTTATLAGLTEKRFVVHARRSTGPA